MDGPTGGDDPSSSRPSDRDAGADESDPADSPADATDSTTDAADSASAPDEPSPSTGSDSNGSDSGGSDSNDPNHSSDSSDSGQSHAASDGSDAAAATDEAGPRSKAADAGSSTGSGGVTTDDGLFRYLLETDDSTVVFLRDVLVSVGVVVLVALILFGVSGIWPPLVAVESGSMEPNMHRGDLIFVTADDRFIGDDPVAGTGVVTYEVGVENDHGRFGEPGDVIIFTPNGNEDLTPIIHRAQYWVEEDENWVDTKANPEWTNGNSCDEIQSCPAQHDGFITKGDANRGYDQAGLGGASATEVVRPEWIEGKAIYRIPFLGYVRLTFDSLFFVGADPFVSGAQLTFSVIGGIGSGAHLAAGAVAGGATVIAGRRT